MTLGEDTVLLNITFSNGDSVGILGKVWGVISLTQCLTCKYLKKLCFGILYVLDSNSKLIKESLSYKFSNVFIPSFTHAFRKLSAIPGGIIGFSQSGKYLSGTMLEQHNLCDSNHAENVYSINGFLVKVDKQLFDPRKGITFSGIELISHCSIAVPT